MELRKTKPNEKESSSHCLPPKKSACSDGSASLYLRGATAGQLAKVLTLKPTRENWAEYERLRVLSRRLRNNGGFGWWWPLVVLVVILIILVCWLAEHTRHTFFYSYPNNYLRIVQNVDPYTFVVQRVENGIPLEETEMHFCRDYQPRFEAGHVLAWIRYNDLGSCASVGPEDRGYDVLKVNHIPVLAPNCRPDWGSNHVVCEGGRAKF